MDKSPLHTRKTSVWGCGADNRILAYILLRPETWFWRCEQGRYGVDLIDDLISSSTFSFMRLSNKCFLLFSVGQILCKARARRRAEKLGELFG